MKNIVTNITPVRSYFVIAFLLAFACLSAKQIPTVTGLLKTIPGSYVVNTPDSVSTNVTAIAGTADYKIFNTVALKYDLYTDTFFLNSATVKVKIRVRKYNASNVLISTTPAWLNISVNGKYNSPMIEQNMLKLSNGYGVRVVLDSVWVNGVQVASLPRYVSIESEINLDRYYDFSTATNTGVTPLSLSALLLDCDTIKDELQFSWTPNVRAEEYQVEWAYVNNYNASGTGTYPSNLLRVDFKHNSTRITTKGSSYKVALLYNKGFIAFRVRAVGRDYLNPDKYIYGPWSCTADKPLLSSLNSSSEYYNIFSEHEKRKNWQYSASYAEEGKKKEVINYFDGSYHNRQTVTKINSDKHVIVGETIYDYQGRPAVNVLPVPVDTAVCTEPAIKYYVKFNVNDFDSVYSKYDFDADSGTCVALANPMDTTAGASKYYSNNNPDMAAQQGFLPHAKEYPFSQTEYTPDNTGRIRTQTGVGNDFKLGSGKETKYLYGQPNQIQVDRLFGSEAGDASHYKKNIVTDPNGQSSVTYLNQSGKTIATALAGDLPTDPGSGSTQLSYLNSAWSPNLFTVDLFNKNSNGVSLLNTVPASYDRIEFSSQLLVPYASNYTFNYDLSVDTLGDPCLKNNVCIGCVYNLEIKVKDECGIDLVPAANGGDSINYVIGKVDTTGNQINFSMLCSGPTLFQDSANVTMYLQPGVYTISKVLKVNQDAKDFFVKNYLDTTYNSCVKTLNYFMQQELSKIDTMDCYNSCANCASALGAKDVYVSSGKGTAAQWEILHQQCLEPCRQKTLCDIRYDMMLSDVSPGGQYAKYNTITNSASAEPVSVLNPQNIQNSNFLSNNQAHWKFPRFEANGTIYPVYLDDNGDRTKVIVSGTSPSYLPPLDNNALVYTDTITNQLYTYPENLTNLEDFIPVWSSNFARSLVMYHPEYAYYKSCSDHSVKFPGEARTSDQFDSLMFASETFVQAYRNGFIDSTLYMGSGLALNKFKPFWLLTSTFRDPFIDTCDIYKTYVNSITGAQTAQNMPINLATTLYNKILNYKVINGVGYSMADVAAIVARCGNNFNSVPTLPCLAFGNNFYNYTTTLNDSIRNQEWKLFRSFYFAEKQKLQFKRMEFYAKNLSGGITNYYGGSSCCFNNPGFNFWTTGMNNGSNAASDPSQPCHYGSYWKYANSIPRFTDPENSGLNASNAGLQTYQSTGQCPIVFQLQGFLNKMAGLQKLDNSSVYMNQINEFTPDMYNAINNGVTPNNFINYKWMVGSNTGVVLNINFVDTIANTTNCTLKLDITGTSIPAFDSIISITQLVYNSSGSGTNPFKAVASYKNGGLVYSANILGNSCFKLKSCAFEAECTGNQFANDVLVLFNMLKSQSKLTAAGAFSMYASTNYIPLISTAIKNKLGTPNSYIKYQYIAPNKLTFYDSTNVTTKLVFTILNFSPGTQNLTNTASYGNIKSNYNNLFTMDGFNSLNVDMSDVTGKAEKITSADTTGISMGTCGLADPPECNTKAHKVRKDLEKLLIEVFSKSLSPSVDLYTMADFSALLQTYLPPGTDSTYSSYAFSSGTNPNYDTLNFTIPGCNLDLFHYRNNGSSLNFADIVDVDLEGIGSPDIAGNYYNFQGIATYSVALDSLVTDTIYGTSCWPIKHCVKCTAVDSVDVDNFTNVQTPGSGPGVPNGNVGRGCALFYVTYLAKIDSFNASAYASFNTYYVDSLYSNSNYFALAGYCACAQSYVAYLDSLRSLGGVAGPVALNINQWQGCAHTYPPASTCDSLYLKYINVVDQYNDSVVANVLPYPQIDTVHTAAYFKKLCVCGKKFIANITAVINGASIPPGMVNKYLDLKSSCDFPPCNGGPPDSAFVFPTYTAYDNPCVKQMLNLAAQNASNAYQNYKDSMTTIISALYSKHCLSPFESFHNTYTDQEYHFTLYYYDQAGNLVKTIPPEGVEPLNITSNTDSLELKVIFDRTNNQQNVFTAHRMPTKYVYNSLNQLVYQTMPDHDNMNLCDGLRPSGLDTSLVITSLQFVTPNKGYLCGTADISSTQKRGYMYTTNDAGGSWTRVHGIVGGDLQKVQFVSNTDAFAVSTTGMVLKSVDGGNTWDLITSLYSPASGLKYFSRLTDLYFTSANNGVVGGIKASGQGAVYYTSNGGVTFDEATVTGISNGDTLTGFTYNNLTYYASFKNGLKGRMFTSTNTTTWTEFTSFAANNLKKVQYISDTLAFAVGEDGTLLRSTSPNSSWQLLPTGTAKNFIDVHFKNRAEGVAIIDSSSGKGKIWKTFNGGVTWNLLSQNGEYFYAFKGYGNDTTQHKILAAGQNGLITKVLITTQPFGMISLLPPSSANFAYADAFSNDTLNTLLTLLADKTAGKLHVSYNGQANNPNWLNYYSAQAGNTTSDSSYKKVLVSVSNSASPALKAIVLSNSGQLYRFYKASGSAPVMAPVNFAFSATRVFADITANTHKDTTNFYAFDTVSKQVYHIRYNGLNVANAVLLSGATAGNIQSFEMSNLSTRFMAVGSGGNSRYGNLSSGTVSWTDVTNAAKPAALTKVRSAQTNSIISVGIDGAYWNKQGSIMRLRNTGVIYNFRSMASDTLGRGLLCGDNGALMRFTLGGSLSPALVNINSPINSNLTDVALDTTSHAAYITAANGKVIYFASYLASVNSLAATATNKPLNGVSFKPATIGAYAVGNNATLIHYIGTSSGINKHIYPSMLRSAHFTDVNNGYVIDSASVIRQTTDAGQTWHVVKPDTNLPVLTRVFCAKQNQAVIIGASLYSGVINSNVLTQLLVSAPSNEDFNGIDINPSFPNNGIIVGTNGNAYRLTASGPLNWTISHLGFEPNNPHFNAVHVFKDTSFIAVGNKDYISYYNGGSFYDQNSHGLPGSGVFNDVFFHDDYTGYAVGQYGVAFKCDLSDRIQNEGVITNNISWQPFCSNALYPSGYNSANISFNTVSFSSRNKGMLAGGDYNFTTPFYSQKYAKLINDQGGYYSTRFWYDKLGRMVVSQNTKQFNKRSPSDTTVQQAFSYTSYDVLGRISEVGEKFENHATVGVPLPPKFKGIFGSNVNGFFNVNTIDDTKLNSWLTSTGSRRDVTQTFYDDQTILPTSLTTQENLRKRVSTVMFEDVHDGYDSTYKHATHYSYDIHGNVKTLWQEYPLLTSINQHYKKIDYGYDLISGKVNTVSYQKDSADQFIHKYSYDADNRITKVETSRDNMIWETDAKYFYYAHGPLARIEYGKDQVQGMDFAYTLQGWIKGVNSNILHYTNDIGRDGDTTGGNPNGNFGRDAASYSLGYYKNDYEAIDYNKWNNASTRFEAYMNYGWSNYSLAQKELYNGNIQRMVTTISNPDTLAGNIPTAQSHYPLGSAYSYDQLNRLLETVTYQNLDTTTLNNVWNRSRIGSGPYYNNFTYDANGNILTSIKADGGSGYVDDLIYNYQTDGAGQLMRNRLYHVNDNTGAPVMGDDIGDQGTFTNSSGTVNKLNNYRYDEIGNMVRDSIEEIDTIKWNVYGKISYIKRKSWSLKPDLYFDYDAQGNRIAKSVYDSLGNWIKTTHYIRDVQGNVMSTYDYKTLPGPLLSYKQKEMHLYGSSRLGIASANLEMIGAITNLDTVKVYLGNKQYELSNHLGNVITTVSDKKIAVENNNDSIIDYYVGDIISATDYYAFGQQLYGRKFSSPSYRYGFNGKENDDEVKGAGNQIDFGARSYDPRLGRWFAVDLYTSKHPDLTPYHFGANSPIMFLDGDGLDIVYFNHLGQEMKNLRVVDDKVNKTYVQVQQQYVSPTPYVDNTPMPMRVAYQFVEAPMPGIIENFSDDKYQKYDYQIAASTFLFNQNKNNGQVPEYTNGTKLSDPETKVPDLSPNLVKAIIMEETMMGTYDITPNDKNDSKTDIMQANVYYGPAKDQNDWSDSKAQFGLTKGGGVKDPAQSIKAGIGILYQKGLKGGSGVKWTGGSDWMKAAEHYNGGGNPNYVSEVKSMIESQNKSTPIQN